MRRGWAARSSCTPGAAWRSHGPRRTTARAGPPRRRRRPPVPSISTSCFLPDVRGPSRPPAAVAQHTGGRRALRARARLRPDGASSSEPHPNASPGRGVSPPPRTSALAPFRVRSFRFQWPADLAASWAFEMETLILGWYVLVETGSVLLLTVFGSLQYVGTLVAPMFGVVGDRIGLRNLLCAMRACYALLAATLMALALARMLAPPHVFAVAALAGLVRPSDLVMRNALVGETMPPAHLMAAMSVSRTTADSARIAGALAGAGLVAALGMAAAYVAICGLYATSLLLTLGVATSAPAAATAVRSSPWRDLADAAAHVRATPHLLAAMCLAFLVNLTALPWMGGLLPYVAREVYGMGQTGLGWLVASFALGALAGSIVLSRIGGAIRPGRVMILASIAWYGLLLAFAAAEEAAAGFVVLGLAGFTQSLALVPLAVMLLRGAGARLRGRIMGLRMLAVYGMPLGLLAAGPTIERCGFAPSVMLYGSLGLALTLLIALRWRRHLWPRDAPANAG
ncbi:MAG: MFS transporter [Alphaproteobacteria bacterium]|nr:MFS transporter [Alphaproteobacteria bacterium]